MKVPKQSATIVALSAASTAAVFVVWVWRHKRKRANNTASVKTATVECVCGKVCLHVNTDITSNNDVVHMVCYCEHCQHYAQCLCAHHLKRSVVDAQGGTRTCQVYRRHVSIKRGGELLQFSYFNPNKVPLRPQQMFRAHTNCCKTPLISAFWRELPVMGLYAANIKIDGQDDFIHVNPTTQLWDDDNHNNHNHKHGPFIYRINCQYALAQAPSEPSSPLPVVGSQEPQQQQQPQLQQQSPPHGSPGFPFGLLIRFLWRNYIVGPRFVAATDFDIPANHQPILIPSEMNSVPVFPLYDLIFG